MILLEGKLFNTVLLLEICVSFRQVLSIFGELPFSFLSCLGITGK